MSIYSHEQGVIATFPASPASDLAFSLQIYRRDCRSKVQKREQMCFPSLPSSG